MKSNSSKQYFDNVATDWDNMGAGFFGEAPRVRIYQELDLRKVQSIADISSGSGYLLERLIGRGLDLYGIDQSSAMLERIIEKFQDANEVSELQGSAEQLPLSNDSVDIVITNMYLHHVERPAQAIDEMARVLRSGGTLIFTDLDSHDYKELLDEQHDQWIGFDRQDIMIWMEDAGFEDVMIDCVGSDCYTSTSTIDQISISIFITKGIKK